MENKSFKSSIEKVCIQNFGCPLSQATDAEAFRALCIAVREQLVVKNHEFRAVRADHG